MSAALGQMQRADPAQTKALPQGRLPSPFKALRVFLLFLVAVCVKGGKMPRPSRVANAYKTVISSSTLEGALRMGTPLHRILAMGNTSSITTSHPVIRSLVERWSSGSTPRTRALDGGDGCKIALCIEGGGMRGCVAAGSTAALHFLGLADAFDCVYGSSAGSMVGAYFVSRQRAAGSIYSDVLPAAGRDFIDKSQLLQALGITAPTIRAGQRSSAIATVIDLNFLLDEVMREHQPLDLDTFIANDVVQPLHIVASSLATLKPVVFSSKNSGQPWTMDSLLQCIRASMNVPGVTGRLMAVSAGQCAPQPFSSPASAARWGLGGAPAETQEPLADAFLAEPMPYRSAAADGATHCLVLRTRPDPSPTLGRKPGLYERVICSRFFKSLGCDSAADWMTRQQHLRVYAEDLTLLNDAAAGPTDGVKVGGRAVHLLPLAPAKGRPEVSQLETHRAAILAGMKDGARRTLQVLAPALLDACRDLGAEAVAGRDKSEAGSAMVEIDAAVEDMLCMIFPETYSGSGSDRVGGRGSWGSGRGWSRGKGVLVRKDAAQIRAEIMLEKGSFV